MLGYIPTFSIHCSIGAKYTTRCHGIPWSIAPLSIKITKTQCCIEKKSWIGCPERVTCKYHWPKADTICINAIFSFLPSRLLLPFDIGFIWHGATIKKCNDGVESLEGDNEVTPCSKLLWQLQGWPILHYGGGGGCYGFALEQDHYFLSSRVGTNFFETQL